MRKQIFALATAAALTISAPVLAQDENGVITLASANSAAETTQMFEGAVEKAGFKVFALLDHAAAAKDAGLEMPYSTVVVFGNPKLGTPGFLNTPKLAIDLPLKALVWEDADGKVWLSYNSSQYMFETIYDRHGQPYPEPMIEKLGGGLAKMAKAATE